ncbi:MAG TPA: hypothetical protein VHN14_00050 [Kofleriaceae bacterium]|nr:hypothetical protein [Kofleriaceae bacterium]
MTAPSDAALRWGGPRAQGVGGRSSQTGRGNLRATDDLALKSLGYAAAAGHATVSVEHIIAARKDLWS